MIQLNVTSLSKQFGTNRVFTGLTFQAGSTVLGVAGSNGSGKSTLLKCISGLMKPSGGTVEWMINKKKVSLFSIKKLLGYAAPYIQLYEELTVTENLRFITEIRENSINGPIDDLLAELGAEAFAGSHFGSLSTGQQQRVKLAAALIHKPRILILDEPGSNLDKKGQQIIKSIISRFRDNDDLVILASNQKHELDLCDRIIELQS